MERTMKKLIKKAALPALGLAALALAAPAVHAEGVQFTTVLQWGTGPAADNTATSVSNAALAKPGFIAGQLPATPESTLYNGSNSSAVFTNGARNVTISYLGEQNFTSVNLDGVLKGVTFGSFTADDPYSATHTFAIKESFTLSVYEYRPQNLPGHVSFSSFDITGTIDTSSGDGLVIHWDAGTAVPKELPILGTPPAINYWVGQSYAGTEQQVTLDAGPTGSQGVAGDTGPNDQSDIRGDVSAVPVPLPKSASVSLALFGLLGVAGIAKRKSLTV
jgi:hypothetical protein